MNNEANKLHVRPDKLCPQCPHSIICAQYPSPSHFEIRRCPACLTALAIVAVHASCVTSIFPSVFVEHTCVYTPSAQALKEFLTKFAPEGLDSLTLFDPLGGVGWTCDKCFGVDGVDRRDVSIVWEKYVGPDPFTACDMTTASWEKTE